MTVTNMSFPSIYRGDCAEARPLLVPLPTVARSGASEPNDVAATDCPRRAGVTSMTVATEGHDAERQFWRVAAGVRSRRARDRSSSAQRRTVPHLFDFDNPHRPTDHGA